ncbi:MAG: hypothetical protein HQ483_06060, partial [Rhodospirillales bacterium]|nr:hypothetical protein [Rhodospirillales bacterium]
MYGKLIQAIKQRFTGNRANAGGDRAAAVGESANGAVFATGDHNTFHLGQPGAPPLHPIRSHTLPADLADFTGRAEEVARLCARLSAGGGTVAISAIDGLGGIGKSALAVHVGHQLAAAFPAAQLILDLGGTSDAPVTPSAIMAQVIVSLQPMAQLPDDEQTIAAIYRDVLAGGRHLLILDNARDGTQVTSLLPPPPSAAIITSRQPMALANVEALRLDILPSDDARALLREITGAERASDQDLDRIAAACGYLPLALRVAAT